MNDYRRVGSVGSVGSESDREVCNAPPVRPDVRPEIVVPVGVVHGLVLLDALNWKVVRRREGGAWAFCGYHRTIPDALTALAHAEVAAGCAKVATSDDLKAAFEAALLVVATEAKALDARLHELQRAAAVRASADGARLSGVRPMQDTGERDALEGRR